MSNRLGPPQLQTLKKNQLQIAQWRDKQSTRDDVATTIYNYLYSDKTGLPVDSYTPEEVTEKSNVVFLHVFEKYPYLPSPYYDAA